MGRPPSLEPLLRTLEEFDEDMVTLVLGMVALDGRSLRIEFDVQSEEEEEVHSRWQVLCDGVVEHHVSLGSHEWLSEEADHVLLLDHIDRRADLFFTGAAADPMKVVGTLATSHQRAVGGWRPMSRYFNPLVPLPELLAQSSGKLASGPASLLATYDEALEFCGVRTSMLDAGPSKHWDEALTWVETSPDLRALVLMESKTTSFPGPPLGSFVIAKTFGAGTL